MSISQTVWKYARGLESLPESDRVYLLQLIKADMNETEMQVYNYPPRNTQVWSKESYRHYQIWTGWLFLKVTHRVTGD